MFGFWMQRVPDTMEERMIYIPCTLLPPTCDGQYTWVYNIAALSLPGGGMDQDVGQRRKEEVQDNDSGGNAMVDGHALPYIAPAWEAIRNGGRTGKGERGRNKGNGNNDDSGNHPPTGTSTSGLLEIPKFLNHRFFVNDPANFFQESMFKDESF